jgi:hypothetical protein
MTTISALCHHVFRYVVTSTAEETATSIINPSVFEEPFALKMMVSDPQNVSSYENSWCHPRIQYLDNCLLKYHIPFLSM